MTDDHAMNGEEKLLMVSQQLDAIQNNDVNVLVCPYCGKVNVPGTKFCCSTITKAVKVLLDARDKVKQMQREWAN